MAVVVALCSALPARGDGGVTVNVDEQCLPPVAGRVLCASFSVDSCAETIAVNATIDGEPLLAFSASADDSAEVCDDRTSVCGPCYGFKSIELEPGFVRACPRVRLRNCVGELEQDFDCFEFGTRCDMRDCETCAARDGCGWCVATESCAAVSPTEPGQPYCTACASSFQLGREQCASYINSHSNGGGGAGGDDTTSGRSGGGKGGRSGLLIAVVVMGVMLFVALCAIAWYVRSRRRSRDRASSADTELGGPNTHHRPLADLADSADDEGMSAF